MPAVMARMEELVQRLGPRRGSNEEEQLKLVKTIKNEIIGNKNKKLNFIKLGAVPRVLELLASSGACTGSGPTNLQVQCAATLGSFSCVADGVQAVVENNGVEPLLRTLVSNDDAVVAAGARSLKQLYQSPEAQANVQLPDAALQRLVDLLSSQNRSVSEVSARVLARCCQSSHQQNMIGQVGGLAPLLAMLSAQEPPMREAAVDALAALMRDNDALTNQVAAHAGVAGAFLQLLKGSAAHPRLLACTCLTRILPHLPDDAFHSPVEVRRCVLQSLARLLGERESREEAPSILAALIANNPGLQRAAADADAVTKLATSLRDADCSPRLKEGALRALAMLCADQEQSRQQVLEADALSHIVEALRDDGRSVRLAACSCLRSLSRSVKGQRKHFEKVDMAPALLRLLEEDDAAVQCLAASTLSNVLLEFSPVKDVAFAAGCLRLIIRLTSSTDDDLRSAAVWALQNLAYLAEDPVRAALLAALPWTQARDLTVDPLLSVREKALVMVQNLTKATPLEELQTWSGGALIPHVLSLLRDDSNLDPRLQEAVLYCLTNVIATGDGKEADSLLELGLAPLLSASISHMDDKVRLAAVWVIINLTAEGNEGQSADAGQRRSRRKAALCQEGLDACLAELRVKEDSLDIRERADTALRNFMCNADA